MEGSENSSEIKVYQELDWEQSNQKKMDHNTISHISEWSKEMGEANDSSLDWLAKELFRDDSNSHNLSSNNKKSIQFDYKLHNKSMDSEEEGVVLGDLPECSGLVDFIDKTLSLSNQNIMRALSGTLDKQKEGEGKYSITFHDWLEEFKYDCHVLKEQLTGIKSIIGKLIMLCKLNIDSLQ